jgi:hypothetical protein
VTESEWLACEDRSSLLYSWFTPPVRLSPRRERLHACANLRRLWRLLLDPRSREAVLVAERFADGAATLAELQAAHRAAAVTGARGEPERLAARAAEDAASKQPGKWELLLFDMPVALANRAAEDVFRLDEPDLFRKAEAAGTAARKEEKRAQVRLIRDVCNPFRVPPKRGGAPQFRLGDVVLKLAAAAYEERRLPSGELEAGRLAVLADALEEAGVVDAVLLGHLRSPGGRHVRGCFAVDAVLGRS